MKTLGSGSMLILVAALICLPLPNALAQNAPGAANSGGTVSQPPGPSDLAGAWTGDKIPGLTNFAVFDQKIPEPPLTDWAKQHLLYKSISHDALSGTYLPGADSPGRECPNIRIPCFAKDQYGVVANDVDGEYPAKDCEPLSSPAIYDYPFLTVIEILPTREGDRIFALYSYHREWRTWWLNREHPKNLVPTYEGDSTAHWDGNTLVVDTIGYNGKTMVSQNIGHSKSDAFHLVERFHLVDHDHLVIDMTYSDPKAWGDKSWPGFKKYFRRVSPGDFDEFICSTREYMTYDKAITERASKKVGKAK